MIVLRSVALIVLAFVLLSCCYDNATVTEEETNFQLWHARDQFMNWVLMNNWLCPFEVEVRQIDKSPTFHDCYIICILWLNGKFSDLGLQPLTLCIENVLHVAFLYIVIGDYKVL